MVRTSFSLKQVRSIALSAVLSFILVGCGGSSPSETSIPVDPPETSIPVDPPGDFEAKIIIDKCLQNSATNQADRPLESDDFFAQLGYYEFWNKDFAPLFCPPGDETGSISNIAMDARRPFEECLSQGISTKYDAAPSDISSSCTN